MKIYIDADGCPVVRNTLKIAGKFNIPCVIICDTAHQIEHGGAETIVVDKGADSVDFRLVNLIQKGDIAITQDYGLAAMCLSKRAIVLNQDGKEYTKETLIKSRLTALHAIYLQIFRHITQKLLAIRQYACVVFMQSDEKSDCVSDAQDLISVSLMKIFRDYWNFVPLQRKSDRAGED